MHFGYTIVYVPDVGEAVDFYERAFGFACRFRGEEGDYAELDSGSTVLAFAANHMAEHFGFSIVPNRADQPAPGIELAFVTEDVLAGFKQATEAGATAVTDPHQTPWGQTVSYVRDLNGVLVEICSPIDV